MSHPTLPLTPLLGGQIVNKREKSDFPFSNDKTLRQSFSDQKLPAANKFV